MNYQKLLLYATALYGVVLVLYSVSNIIGFHFIPADYIGDNFSKSLNITLEIGTILQLIAGSLLIGICWNIKNSRNIWESIIQHKRFGWALILYSINSIVNHGLALYQDLEPLHSITSDIPWAVAYNMFTLPIASSLEILLWIVVAIAGFLLIRKNSKNL